MFYGREDDLLALDRLWNKPVSSLVTCRGRRRIGKSTLIEEFAKRSKARFIVPGRLASANRRFRVFGGNQAHAGDRAGY